MGLDEELLLLLLLGEDEESPAARLYTGGEPDGELCFVPGMDSAL